MSGLTSALLKGPAFKAIRGISAQSISDAVITKIQLNDKIYDTHNCYDEVTNFRFTPNKAGFYVLTAGLQVNGTSIVDARLRISNVADLVYSRESYSTGSGSSYVVASVVEYFDGVSDYAECFAFCNVVSGSPSIPNSVLNFFSGAFIRSE